MEITFRSLTVVDEPFLWEMLYHAVYLPPGQAPNPGDILQRPELRRYVEGWGRRDDQGLLAEVDGKPVGAAWLRRWVGENRGYGYVDDETPELSIATLPAYRGQGLGSQLLARLLPGALALFPAVSLSVSLANPARRLYERLGFVVSSQSGDTVTLIKRRDPGARKGDLPGQRLALAWVLATRLERLSADSVWAHRASGLRGALLKAIEGLENEPAPGQDQIERLDALIGSGFHILEAAAREILELRI